MREMLYLFFYPIYIFELIIKFLKYGLNAYENISFEREAYRNENDFSYLVKRKPFAWLGFFIIK